MRRFLDILVVLFVVFVVVPSAAAAPTRDDLMKRCNDLTDLRVAIRACTSLIDKGTETRVDRAAAHFNRGYAYGRIYDSDGSGLRLEYAIADFAEALRLDPTDAEAAYNRGIAQMFAGRYDRALADFDAAMKLDPRMPWKVLEGRCYVRAMLGQTRQALADCNDALARFPDSEFGRADRGFVYLKLKEFDAAIRDYNALLDRPAARNILERITAPKLERRYEYLTKTFYFYASWLYGRGLAKRARGDVADGDDDITAATRIDPAIETKFERCTYQGLWAYEDLLIRELRLGLVR